MSHTVEQKAKQIGMNLSANKHSEILDTFRCLARNCPNDEVDIDDVRRLAEDLGRVYTPGNWLGSVFSRSEWEWTGKVRASSHPGSHGRMIKIWRRRHDCSS